MSKTVIFYWDFSVTTDDKRLNVYLNDGLSTRIYLDHEKAFENISRVLAEIVKIEHTLGTKTVVNNTQQIAEAIEIVAKYQAE